MRSESDRSLSSKINKQDSQLHLSDVLKGGWTGVAEVYSSPVGWMERSNGVVFLKSSVVFCWVSEFRGQGV